MNFCCFFDGIAGYCSIIKRGGSGGLQTAHEFSNISKGTGLDGGKG